VSDIKEATDDTEEIFHFGCCTSDFEMRRAALELALQRREDCEATTETVIRAREFYQFLNGDGGSAH
jgi:hypothetical protein